MLEVKIVQSAEIKDYQRRKGKEKKIVVVAGLRMVQKLHIVRIEV